MLDIISYLKKKFFSNSNVYYFASTNKIIRDILKFSSNKNNFKLNEIPTLLNNEKEYLNFKMDVMGRSRDLTPFLISPKNLSNYISKIKNLIGNRSSHKNKIFLMPAGKLDNFANYLFSNKYSKINWMIPLGSFKKLI